MISCAPPTLQAVRRSTGSGAELRRRPSKFLPLVLAGTEQGGVAMRRMVLGTLVALPLALAVSASAGMEQREATTTTTYSGTISDVSPSSSTIVLKSEGSPQTMKY